MIKKATEPKEYISSTHQAYTNSTQNDSDSACQSIEPLSKKLETFHPTKRRRRRIKKARVKYTNKNGGRYWKIAFCCRRVRVSRSSWHYRRVKIEKAWPAWLMDDDGPWILYEGNILPGPIVPELYNNIIYNTNLSLCAAREIYWNARAGVIPLLIYCIGWV